ncbi:hypothetical protein ACJX0J_035387 [Zea mays]
MTSLLKYSGLGQRNKIPLHANKLVVRFLIDAMCSHYIVVLPFIIYLTANIYAADVNQLAALSEDVDNEEPQKLKRGKKMEVKKSGKAKKKDKHASQWILECKHKRPGLKALQEAIDEFIVAHEEQQEKCLDLYLVLLEVYCFASSTGTPAGLWPGHAVVHIHE